MMSKEQKPLSIIYPSILLFLFALTVMWKFSDNEHKFQTKLSSLNTESIGRHISDEKLSLHIMSFDNPERAIMEADFNGNILWTNEYGSNYWGVKPGNVVHDLIPESLRVDHLNRFNKHLDKLGPEVLSDPTFVAQVHMIECDAINLLTFELEAVTVKIFLNSEKYVVFVDHREG